MNLLPEKWLHVFKFGNHYGNIDVELEDFLAEEESLTDVVEGLRRINADDIKRHLLEDEEKSRRDHAHRTNIVLKNSYNTGHADGRAEGHTEGREEERRQFVLRLYAKGFDKHTITDITELSLDYVASLKPSEKPV